MEAQDDVSARSETPAAEAAAGKADAEACVAAAAETRKTGDEGESAAVDEPRTPATSSRPGKSRGKGKGRGRGEPEVREGDWECPKCGMMVFASKDSCFKCAKSEREAEKAATRGTKRKRRTIPGDDSVGAGSRGEKDGEQAAREEGSTTAAPRGEEVIDREQLRERRAARKAAEQEDFKRRCNEGCTVLFDLEWEEQLHDREVKGLVQQVLYSYGANRSAAKPVNLVLSGVGMGTQTKKGLQKLAGYPQSWLGVEVVEEAYFEHYKSEADRQRLVYLTADSEQVLDRFDPEKIYIIGGIVDRNRLKGVTASKAAEQGIATAKLPLEDVIDMGVYSRVLTCNHCVDIILEHQRCENWRQTFEKCVPGRKRFKDSAPDANDESKDGSAAAAETSVPKAAEGGEDGEPTAKRPCTEQEPEEPAASPESAAADQPAAAGSS
eukprot:TRINITY_DN9908_c0_g1_i2.p1 TRINITY_DN9908_c0_g1~~TRINITY_DN9908_c0_g1_i2.p1  ORF type:complete len:461 (+),score=135.48 TRINITY_DN9908_c0_g1_i2:70-1383(+)